jgi:enhancing lycopene biosynthesis protein 2
MQPRIAVIIAGCGLQDGAEVNEVVLTLLALEQQGFAYDCYAPNVGFNVVDHQTGQATDEQRSVLTEAARLVRTGVLDLATLAATRYVGYIVTGGYGVLQHLSNFATAHTDMRLQPDFIKAATAFKMSGKPAGYLCIAPILLPKIYAGIRCTVGNDATMGAAINAMGGIATVTSADTCCYDPQHQVISTAAFMLAQNLMEAQQGINALVTRLAQQVSSIHITEPRAVTTASK